MPIETLWRDLEVAENFVLDRIERKSAHAVLRGVCAQLDGVLGPNVAKRSMVPASCRIDPVQSHQERVTADDGVALVLDKKTDVGSLVLPDTFLWRHVLSTVHTLDRGSIGRAAVCSLRLMAGCSGVSFGVCVP